MKLKDCDSCLVYGSDKRPLARARVVGVEGNIVQLFFGTNKLRNARLKTIVDFYDGQQGLVRCLCDMVLKKNQTFSRINEPWMADCTIVKVYEVFQRQKDLRVKVHIGLEFMTAEELYFTGIIQNISAGGLYLVTSHKMKPGQFFTYSYCFRSEMRKIQTVVLRAQELPKGGYGYGCKFVDLSQDAEADIRKFVYAKQIEMQLEKKRKQEALGNDML